MSAGTIARMSAGTVGATLVVARTAALTAEGHIPLAGDHKGRPYNGARKIARVLNKRITPRTKNNDSPRIVQTGKTSPKGANIREMKNEE